MEEQKMQLVDWLDDLCVRFIINLPQEELESVERICFQIEEAQWFYEDFIRPLDHTLPSLPLRSFALQIFRHCPLLSAFDENQHIQAFDQFLEYKTRVPVRGAILLNDAMDQAVLVRGWKKGANWSFPRGKINKDERDLDCAIREAYEETGYDLREAGLAQDESKMKFIEVTMREQHMKLFVFKGVPMDTHFEPRTRKEISKIQWYKLSSLPGWRKKKQQAQSGDGPVLSANKVYMVAPFLPSLKGWIAQQRKLNTCSGHVSTISDPAAVWNSDIDDYLTDERDAQRAVDRHANAHEGDSTVHPQMPLVDRHPYENPTQDADAAAALKRLLSIGQASQLPVEPQQPVGLDPNRANLLSLLQGNPNQHHAPATHDFGQHSLPQQIHDQQHGTMGPQHQQHGQWHEEQTGLPQNVPFYHGPFQHTQYSNNVFAQPHQPSNSYQPPQEPRQDRYMAAGLQGYFNAPMDQSQGHKQVSQPAAPYHRIGDPEFARPQASHAQQGNSMPAASELHAPKLSAQGQRLLDVFKGGSLPIQPSPTGRPSRSTQPAPTLAEQQSEQGQSNRHHATISHQAERASHQYNDSRSRQALDQPMPDRNEPPKLQPVSPPTAPVSARANPQQYSALLDLFRKPSNPAPLSGQAQASEGRPVSQLLHRSPEKRQMDSFSVAPSVPSDIDSSPSYRKQQPVLRSGNISKGSPPKTPQPSSRLAVDPVELSADPSPNTSKRQLFDHKDGKMKEHTGSPRIATRPQSSGRTKPDQEGSLTSATVTGPVPEPDFGSAKRRARQTRPEQKPAKPAVPAAPTHGTVKIMKRPETPKESGPPETATVPKADHKSPEKAETMRRSPARRVLSPKPLPSPSSVRKQEEVTKPFAPKILKRPQQAPNDQPKDPTSDNVEKPHATVNTMHDNTASTQVVSPKTGTERNQDLLSLLKRPSETAQASPAPDDGEPQIETDVAARSSQAMPADAGNHAQNLLSLFSKPTTPASASKPPNRGESQIFPRSPAPAQTATPMARSRLNSLAESPLMSPSAGSRRGSQTPISPGDRGFLLHYLEGFSKGQGQKK